LIPPKGAVLTVTGLTQAIVLTKNTNGQQATYKGHFLYTYIKDTKPLVANGNLVENGKWHVVPANIQPKPQASAS
jgi:predicted lipoprotein with Yx(FWY)xxD motif